MTSKELTNIMKKHDLKSQGLADVLGVTKQAVDHWVFERRAVPEMVARIMRMFDSDSDDIEYFESFKSK